jgi:hypothetical protein
MVTISDFPNDLRASPDKATNRTNSGYWKGKDCSPNKVKGIFKCCEPEYSCLARISAAR